MPLRKQRVIWWRLKEIQVLQKRSGLLSLNLLTDFSSLRVVYLLYSSLITKFGCSSQNKVHFEGVMKNKVLHDINEAEKEYKELEHQREVSFAFYC